MDEGEGLLKLDRMRGINHNVSNWKSQGISGIS